MKTLSPWSKVWLLVVAIFALTVAAYATPEVLEVEWSWHTYNFYYRLAYFIPVIGVIALYLIRFKGRVMDTTPAGATEAVAQELIASKHIVERSKGRLTVRLSKSVGAVVSAKQIGQQSQLHYGLKPMPRGDAWLIILVLLIPALALLVAAFYLSKVVRFGKDSLDEITLRASLRPGDRQKSIGEMLTEGLSEARRISLEAYEASRSNYQDMMLLTLVVGMIAAAIAVVSIAFMDSAETINVDGDILPSVGIVAFAATTIASMFAVRWRLRPRLDDLGSWRSRLSYALEWEARPTADEMAASSQFELLVGASRKIPEWLEIRRKSMLAREPIASLLLMYLLLYGILLALGGGVWTVQGGAFGLVLFSIGALLIVFAVFIYRASLRRRSAEAKALGDSWRRQSEEMTLKMESLLGGRT